jgi:geranylgeranyl diphosphate synthase type II
VAGGSDSESRRLQAAARVEEMAALVERSLESALPGTSDSALTEFASGLLVESMRYSLATPGKRVRPLLCLGGVEAVGADPLPFVRFAGALEMIHAYSLVHDDHPAMDDDELRRGLPTNHMVYGGGMAILAGDGLLTEAFSTMIEPLADIETQLRVIAEVSRAAGWAGMVGGQAADLMAENMEADELVLRSLHARKTGALICASVRAGAMLGRGGPEALGAVSAFGERFGLAFQIADDVKDEIAPTSVTGKQGGRDREAGKMTYPALYGVEGSRSRCREELERAIAALGPLGPAACLLEVIARDAVAPAFEDYGNRQ